MINRRRALFGLPALLSACASQNAVDGSAIGPDDGLLVMQASGNVFGSLGYDRWGDRTVGAQLTEGLLGVGPKMAFGTREELVVLPLAAGEYMWTRLNVHPHFAWLQKSTRFKIARGTITYIGALEVNVAAAQKQVVIRVQDRESQARTALAQQIGRAHV